MEINPDTSMAKYQLTRSQSGNFAEQYNNKIEGNKIEKTEEDQELKDVVDDFSAILLNKMFASMRDTLPENKFLDAGFSEDVFTDMLYREISKQGAKQQGFDSLNELLYRQLNQLNQSNQGE